MFRNEDWDGFFALFQNNLANFALISIIMLGMDFPPEIVFGYVIPGAALAVLLGNLYYAWMAKRLAEEEGRDDVTALSYGISTPPMFVFLFAILSVALDMADGNHLLAWQVTVAAAFLGGVIEVLGAIIGPWLRENLPRAAMLGALAGVAVSFIGGELLIRTFEMPIIGFFVLSIIVIGLIARAKMPFRIPTSIVALVLGTVLAYALGQAEWSAVAEGMDQFGFYPFLPTGAAFVGMGELFTAMSGLLAALIPIQIYNFIETMNNVEAVAALGDDYNVRECMVVDGVGTMFGSLFGGCFPTTIYIASVGAKEMKAGGGYSIGNGAMFAILALVGGIAAIAELIPLPVIAPILVFVGAAMIANAFMSSPHRHAPAVAIAMLPYLFNYLTTNFQFEGLANEYPALESLSEGALITALVWGAMICFVIDRQWIKAMWASVVGYALAATGFIHMGELGWNFGEPFAVMYLVWGIVMLVFWGYYQYRPEDQGDFDLNYLKSAQEMAEQEEVA